MSLPVNNYQTAVQSFIWPEQPIEAERLSQLATPKEIEAVVTEVARSIINASEKRSELAVAPQTELSLVEACYILAERHDVSKITVSSIQQASADEKLVLKHTFEQLSNFFEQVNANDLKAATLLFGADRVHAIVTLKLTTKPKTGLELLEEQVAQLEAMKAQLASLPAAQQQLMRPQIDALIAQARTKIAAVRVEQENTLKAEKEASLNK